MKNITLAIAFLLLAVPAFAFELNPDRFPSIGINTTLIGSAGESEVLASGLKQDVSSGFFGISIDGRLPISENVTLNGAFSLGGNTTRADETAVLAGQEVKTGQFGISVGMRIYFH